MTKDRNILKADGGKVLTNEETFGTTVYLGKNDSADNWHEITDEEHNEIIANEGGDTDVAE